ncbi:NUDIX hydrolase [Flavobacterium cellulosilyticum]|uniref:NUDIX hydrolase n=1 Tax=Flavobacterium cellulosilyticum TaxID=2541731 RepID=A0A4R5C9M5_9FLAO|nr:NUDIX hydrolase [Flavobacterium cellulosilyticum]TDD94890.1 NUDIX hydrolase [Flavobacterium cellulosilyticum]
MFPKIIPNISVDCVVFGFNITTKSLNVLLLNRYLESKESQEILVNDYVLTGYHALENETIDDTATRVLKELTGFDNLYKNQFKVFGDPNRLMNEKDIIWAENQNFNQRTITIAYYFLVKTHEVDIENNLHQPQWFPVNSLPELGFDHKLIINEAYADLKAKSLTEPIIFELLPNKFTVKELQEVYESILCIEIDNRNFRRKLLTKKYLIELDEKQVGVSKKPSKLFMFSKDIYQKIFKESYLISI